MSMIILKHSCNSDNEAIHYCKVFCVLAVAVAVVLSIAVVMAISFNIVGAERDLWSTDYGQLDEIKNDFREQIHAESALRDNEVAGKYSVGYLDSDIDASGWAVVSAGEGVYRKKILFGSGVGNNF